MLDRVISGAGAVTDAADRVVRALGRGGSDGAGRRPGSLIVAVVCAILAVFLLLAGLEGTVGPNALAMTPDQVVTAGDIGSRTFATIAGSLATDYLELYVDANGNGVQDNGESARSWYYFLVDPATKSGVTVHSQAPPESVFVLATVGRVVTDPSYVAADQGYFAEQAKARGFSLDKTRYLDATGPKDPDPSVVALADGVPTTKGPVRIAGSLASGYMTYCSGDANRNGSCDAGEIDRWDVAMFDPATGVAITVRVDKDPEYTAATFTGMLRRDERAVSEAKAGDGSPISDTGLDVSDHYLLEAGSAPASAPVMFGLAGLLGLLAGTILLGLAGGYLVFRSSGGGLPSPATTLGVEERIPVRVTGLLRSVSGLIHVREVSSDLVRFQTTVADTDPVGSTLIVQRHGRPEGVALGSGELTTLSRGQVTPFRGRRPAVRVTAGTGPLALSFDTDDARDRAVAELLDEAGLTPGEAGSAHA